MALTINLEEHNNYILLDIIGAIDASNAGVVDRYLEFIVSNYNKHLLIDGSQLQSTTIAGLQVFIKAKQKVPLFKMMIFCNITTGIMSLIELSGIASLIPIVPNIIDGKSILKKIDSFHEIEY
ncbi:MAG: STAS domain-containing protein [Candidatus Endonucleobacter sp. (ex Gigantidas childressi)]|nr:STAS domain-containing protein [Candidatus Endonucleobacter sp. (ex Gigantidas childressi)]